MRKLFIISGIIICYVTSTFTQDLLADMQKTSAVYKTYPDFTIEWLNYLSYDKENAEKILIHKCGEKYMIKGLGQMICINDNKQVLLYPDEKIAVYSESDKNFSVPDPIETIKSIVQTADNIEFKWSGDLKYYKINTTANEGYIELWIAQNPWRVKKVIQHQGGIGSYNFVFELQRFETYCQDTQDMQISSYIQNTNGKVSLTSPYKDFELNLPHNNTYQK